MKFSDFIVMEGVTHLYKSFEKWAKAVHGLGANNLVISADRRKRIAISDARKPSLKKYGEWDEKHEEGWTYDTRRNIRSMEINLASATPLRESDDLTDQIPFGKNEEIRKLIKKGAMDPEHQWTNALDLVHRAYEVAEVERPTPSMRDAWDQYEENLLYSVQMLQKSTDKGMRDDSWKTHSLT